MASAPFEWCRSTQQYGLRVSHTDCTRIAQPDSALGSRDSGKLRRFCLTLKRYASRSSATRVTRLPKSAAEAWHVLCKVDVDDGRGECDNARSDRS